MPGAAGDWDGVRRRLATELAELAEDEFLVLGEPAGEPGPPRGLLRRRTPPAPTRFTQVRRDGRHLYAECVGSTAVGGDLEVDPADHERLRALGWLVPGEDDPSGVQPSYPAYWRVLPVADADQVAGLCADALAVLGADPASLDWLRDS